jgi:hypothetical protein
LKTKFSSPAKAIISLSVLIIFCLTMIGCQGMKVPLRSYHPVFTGDYDLYKGKRIYLMNFNNHARDTGIKEYYSPDMKFRYSSEDLVSNYFWFSFQNAFKKLGMIVSDEDLPDYTATGLWATLLSISDEKYHVLLTVEENKKIALKKEYSIQEPLLAEKDRNPAALEQRAYRMTNRLIATILEDSDFRKFFAK